MQPAAKGRFFAYDEGVLIDAGLHSIRSGMASLHTASARSPRSRDHVDAYSELRKTVPIAYHHEKI